MGLLTALLVGYLSIGVCFMVITAIIIADIELSTWIKLLTLIAFWPLFLVLLVIDD